MSFDSIQSRNDYVGDGSTDTYDATFYFFQEPDLLVTLRDPSGNEHPLQLNIDYLVSGAGEEDGGAVELLHGGQAWIDNNNCFAANWHVTIRRVLVETQITNLRDMSTYFPDVVEDQFDRCVMIDQQLEDAIDRSVSLPETILPSAFNPKL